MATTRIDSRHLRLYVAVAEELSFRKAAEKLHLAQPAVTRQIQALEAELQVQLLFRNRRHVALTPAGRTALLRSKALLGDLDDLVIATQKASRGVGGTLRVGFISYAAYHYLPLIMKAYRLEFPQIEIEMSEINIMQQFDMLLENQVDVAIVGALYKDSRIAMSTIARLQYVAALPAGHRLLERKTIEIGDLEGEDLITPPKGGANSIQGRILEFCSSAGFIPLVIREASDTQAMIGLVAAGMGVSVVPESVAKLNTNGVFYKPIQGLSKTANISVAWVRENKSEGIGNFVRIAGRSVKKASY